MTSVVIAAHNEAAVLPRCLRQLLDGAEPGEFEVVVVANGCTDATAELARSIPGVQVLELVEASKSAALNAGDAAATRFPRIYLDADIPLSADGARKLAAATTAAPGGGGLLAAAPARRLDTTGRPLLVRAYYAVNSRLPAFRDALFGRGAIVLSAAGRARFDRFPDQIADDLFLDSLFEVGEKREVAEVTLVVATPRRTGDLLRRLGRVRAGNTAMRATDTRVRRARRASWLVDVVLPRPWLLPAGVCYAALTIAAGISSRRASQGAWGRDESSRVPAEGAPR
ncbi:glycosyltransferase involved in cell wall biosynthesis [Micromonospora pisi]|uniref:4,4'-diaponeurosporenoate glycosyltransferase n=1 Tax=Micromonospora pisi TaxID=589240 RepID=A0A495JI36_9ACTN|nr:glycosyltransferase [Micromonospora pisi]RKR88054.1 glycosyltransferase involved in cell wall biosynthesis [Micromonospora pisi]